MTIDDVKLKLEDIVNNDENNIKKVEDILVVVSNDRKEVEVRMYLNMQYYMKHCKESDYITPEVWIRKYRHF